MSAAVIEQVPLRLATLGSGRDDGGGETPPPFNRGPVEETMQVAIATDAGRRKANPIQRRTFDHRYLITIPRLVRDEDARIKPAETCPPSRNVKLARAGAALFP